MLSINGHKESVNSPIPFIGIQIYVKINNIHVLVKLKNKSSTTNTWKKKFIFFDISF